MSFDPVIREHQEWLGLIQPSGLVVSPTALKNAQARVSRNVTDQQEILLRHTRRVRDGKDNPKRKLNRFREFAKEFWGWEDADLAAPPENLSTALQEYGEILRPDIAVPGVPGEAEWQILIQELPPSQSMDQGGQEADERGWKASPQVRFERLLRDTGVPIGLLVHADDIRLVYAPKGETSGHLTFPIHAMCETAGRPIVSALHLLLEAQRLFNLPKDQRLPAILQASRKYQNEVSIQLAGQVLRALNELCRGFNEANRATGGALLGQTLAQAPEDVYGGLLTTLMRLVFLLYAEDRSLMASGEVYQRCYGLIGSHEKLREDAAAYPDTMDQRFGAWAQLSTLSRLVHDGGGHGWRLPARRGRLFDPDSYPFLEGRLYRSEREHGEKLTPPKIPDGVLYRVLEDLLYLDGERISYRALDVEQIGSVYEAMMGFRVEVAGGPSVGFKPDHVVVNLGTLLAQAPGERKKWLKEHAGWEPAERAAQALKEARTTEEILGALNSRISPLYTDRERGTLAMAAGDIYLQPTEERRRSGSHYTPRSLTEPIVRTTLEPVLQQLGENPTPEQILNLKVCDPAMGSGAFLVEACRYLGDALVKAWAAHRVTPAIPADQDPLLHARRIVAQRCLYGVDKNPFAVDLAKLSLWLATFAKDHPFTFVDHALCCGDSLVGFTVRQISYFDWSREGQKNLFGDHFERKLDLVLRNRAGILDAPDSLSYEAKQQRLAKADEYLTDSRMAGDALAAAFFDGDKPGERARKRASIGALVKRSFDNVTDLDADAGLRLEVDRLRTRGIKPLHWEVEFPEVFRKGGFNAIVGNPPFAGSTMLGQAFGARYTDWLRQRHLGTGGKCDLVSFFFRQSFDLLRQSGSFGLLATKTIAQGDSRSSGLMAIVKDGGFIYNATRRRPWPGPAAVVVSVVHVLKRPVLRPTPVLDDRPVERITSYLVHRGTDDKPVSLSDNVGVAFLGSKPGAKGFVFGEKEGNLSLTLVPHLLQDDRNRRIVRPYIGGDEFNSDPRFEPKRFIIDFGNVSDEVAESYPAIIDLLRLQLRPRPGQANWWHFARRAVALYEAIKGLRRVLAISETCNLLAFGFMTTDRVFSNSLYIFALDQWQAFSICQSRIHERWVRTFASSFKDDQRYVGADCFDTFPFPQRWKENSELEAVGREYYEFRAELMVAANLGLTDTYNQFHDPYNSDPGIVHLRELHSQLDDAVLRAYGWSDVKTACDFILEFEDEENDDASNSRRRRKRYRYRWIDSVQDEVMALLLELNNPQSREPLPSVPTKRIPAARTRKGKDLKTIEMYAEGAAGE